MEVGFLQKAKWKLHHEMPGGSTLELRQHWTEESRSNAPPTDELGYPRQLTTIAVFSFTQYWGVGLGEKIKPSSASLLMFLGVICVKE